MKLVPCIKCGAEIHELMAKANQGLCNSCHYGEEPCVVCGQRTLKNSLGEFIHSECWMERREVEIAESSGIKWRTPNDVDWVSYGREF